MMRAGIGLAAVLTVMACWGGVVRAADPWVVYDGFDGPGKGKHIVLVSGDEEYRSEEALPQLGKILAKHHGFKCTVLFAIDPDGTINPNVSNIPGLEALKTADAMILFTRFRDLPDEQMKHLVDFIDAGKPVLGLRTATHAFNIKSGKTYSKYSYNSKEKGYESGFGKQVLGETWVNHHGKHGSEGTRGILVKEQEKNPILRGIKYGDIFGPTDVYTVNLPLPESCTPLVLGEVTAGLKPTDPPVIGKKNDPMMPIVWTKTYDAKDGKKGKAFTSTMGSSQDLESEGFRRLLVNATYWTVGLEDKIPEKAKVDLVGEYKASPFKGNGFVKGVKPADLAIK
jgi:type 1 glutamine amidotransferase